MGFACISSAIHIYPFAKKSLKQLWLISAVIVAAVLAGWLFWPQQLNAGFIPLIMLIAFRSFANGNENFFKPYNKLNRGK